MFACKCLNITINTKTLDLPSVDLDNLALNSGERSDPFFNEDLGKADVQSIAKEQACLVHVRSVACWIIHRCLNCSVETHALHRDKGANCVLINLKMLTDSATIAALKNTASYSPVFHIIINNNDLEDISSFSNGDISLMGNLHPTLAGLQQQLTEALQRESQDVEERIRAYSEQLFSQLEEYRKKAHEDHKILSRLLLESRSLPAATIGSPVTSNSHSSSPDLKVAPPVPTLPPPPLSSKLNSFNGEGGRMSLASSSQTMPIPNSTGLNNMMSQNHKVNISYSEPRPVPSMHVLTEKSADSEGLFLLDEVDENPPETFQSEDETDTDDSGSHDEGIHIPRARGGASNLAQSLPVSVPVFPGERSHGDDLEEENMLPRDPVDIAASIKALARSVHGDTVFGDLPRPRFSSQI